MEPKGNIIPNNTFQITKTKLSSQLLSNWTKGNAMLAICIRNLKIKNTSERKKRYDKS